MPVAITDNFGTTISLAMPDEQSALALPVSGGGTLTITPSRPTAVLSRTAVSRVGVQGVAVGSSAFSDTSSFGGADSGFIVDLSDTSLLYTDLLRQTQVTQSTDPIGSVEDKTGNGNDLAAPNSSSKPIYTESGGLAFATMGAANSTRLQRASAISGFTSVDELMVVAVFQTHANASARPVTLGDVGSGDYLVINEDIFGSQYRSDTAGEVSVNNVTSADTSGAWRMVSIIKRGSEVLHYVDGSLVKTDTGLSTWSVDLSLAGAATAIRGGSSNEGSGVAYIFAINRAPSEAAVTSIHDYAKAKGGIS